MTVKNGYGNLTDTLINNYVLAVPVPDANRNAIIQLPSKNDKRIITIACGYRLAPGSAGTALLSGRLIVVATKYGGITEEINPLAKQLPDSLGSATVHLDLPIPGDRPFVWDSGLGISIGDGDVSVILTYCLTSGGAAAPASDYVTAWLNVQGTIGGSDKIFKDVK